MVVVEQDGFDIGHLETQALDIFLNRFGGVRRSGTHHDVALGRGQKENFAVGVADEIKISNDFERLGRSASVRDLSSNFERLRGQLFTKLSLPRRERRVRRMWSLCQNRHRRGRDP